MLNAPQWLLSVSALTSSTRICLTPRLSASQNRLHATMAATHSLAEVEVNGVEVPVALWRPEGVKQDFFCRSYDCQSYEYIIDIGGIAKNFRVGWLRDT